MLEPELGSRAGYLDQFICQVYISLRVIESTEDPQSKQEDYKAFESLVGLAEIRY